jgi:hypothetical protein
MKPLRDWLCAAETARASRGRTGATRLDPARTRGRAFPTKGDKSVHGARHPPHSKQ